jgi:hypothetical protein
MDRVDFWVHGLSISSASSPPKNLAFIVERRPPLLVEKKESSCKNGVSYVAFGDRHSATGVWPIPSLPIRQGFWHPGGCKSAQDRVVDGVVVPGYVCR